MKSRTTAQFRDLFASLPQQVQQQAREAYHLFKQDPWHPSLRFKQVHPREPIYSARVSKNYRAVGVRNEIGIVWYWIGTHGDYDNLLSQF
ncbi:MAG: hypothetical protein HWQ41_24845 [Nostoc sp. NOS(2021)]|uniref:ParE family toxin-like protein n=1 Tax=Nostoc sp. NOS(2021) TaxID=2815407 RepID=UPI0025F04F02|nr:hypothetical protein [Nostoc sp. NOS(2021)]MBN3898382.1 hypothetical protein [Nostoc sp. NOS(2021)]